MLVLFLFVFNLSCCNNSNINQDSLSVEQIAFDFFTDNLLDQKLDGEENEMRFLPSELTESNMFLGKKIYTTGKVEKVSELFFDQLGYMNLEFGHTQEEIEAFKRIESSYNEQKDEVFDISLDYSNRFRPLSSYDVFNRLNDNDALFMEVNKTISSDDKKYVQISLKTISDGVSYDDFRFYITLDNQNNVIGWFLD